MLKPQPTLYPVDQKTAEPKRFATPQPQKFLNNSNLSPMTGSVMPNSIISHNTTLKRSMISSVIRTPTPQKLPQPVHSKVKREPVTIGPGSYEDQFNAASTKTKTPAFSIFRQKRWVEEDKNELVAPGKYSPNYNATTQLRPVAHQASFPRAPRFLSLAEEKDREKTEKQAQKKSTILQPNYDAIMRRSASPATFGKSPKRMYYDELINSNAAPGVGKYDPNTSASSSTIKAKCTVHMGRYPFANTNNNNTKGSGTMDADHEVANVNKNASSITPSKLQWGSNKSVIQGPLNRTTASTTPGPGAYENNATRVLSIHRKTPGYSFFKSTLSSHTNSMEPLNNESTIRKSQHNDGSNSAVSHNTTSTVTVGANTSLASYLTPSPAPGVGYYSPNYEFTSNHRRAPSTLLYLTS